MKRQRLVPLILILALAGGLYWFYFHRTGPKEPGVLSLYGNVDVRQVNLGFRVGGHIQTMPLEEGDAVKAGQIIATLDPAPFEENLNQEQARLAAQQATLAKLVSGTRVEEIAQARAAVTAQEATLANAEKLFSKNEAALAIGAVARQDYDTALARRNEAQAQLKSAQEAYREAVNGSRKEDIQAGRANVGVSQAEIQSAKLQLSYTRLIAPSDGIVLTRAREPGAVVGTGDTVYTVSLETPKWVQAYVDEKDLGRIYSGMAAKVFTDTDPDTAYAGQIGFISPVAEFTPKAVETPELRTALVYPIRVTVRDPENRLRQGMPVTVRIETHTAEPKDAPQHAPPKSPEQQP